jgi:chromosome segregation ATPase
VWQLEAENHRLQVEKLELKDEIASSHTAVEEKKAEFQMMAAASARAAEEGAAKLRAEDTRLKSIRETLSKDKLLIDHSKAELRREFNELQAFKDQILAMKMDADTDKKRFTTAARELQVASETLNKEVETVTNAL